MTAARLWDCPLPNRLSADEPLHVSTLVPARAPRSRGIRGHQVQTETPIAFRHGFPVSDPASTWLALASTLQLDDLVAVGDHLVLSPFVLDPHNLRPHTSVEALQEQIARYGARGVRAAASAVRLIRQGAESRPESLLRLLILRAGLPEPAINIDVTDATGRRLGRADLVYPEWRTIVEYDGDQHRTDAGQYDRDITRVEDFAGADWSVVRVRSRGLFVTPDDTVARIERALRRGGWKR